MSTVDLTVIFYGIVFSSFDIKKYYSIVSTVKTFDKLFFRAYPSAWV